MKNHNKFWIVFSLIIVFAAGVVAGIFFERSVLDKKTEKYTRSRRHVRFHESLSSMRTQLKDEIKSVLNEEQNRKFETMIEKYLSQRRDEQEKRKKYSKKPKRDKGAVE